MDNLKAYNNSALNESFEPAALEKLWYRLAFIYAPIPGILLGMVERELNVLNGQCFNRRSDKFK